LVWLSLTPASEAVEHRAIDGIAETRARRAEHVGLEASTRNAVTQIGARDVGLDTPNPVRRELIVDADLTAAKTAFRIETAGIAPAVAAVTADIETCPVEQWRRRRRFVNRAAASGHVGGVTGSRRSGENDERRAREQKLLHG
jgi:hypothetical protein